MSIKDEYSTELREISLIEYISKILYSYPTLSPLRIDEFIVGYRYPLTLLLVISFLIAPLYLMGVKRVDSFSRATKRTLTVRSMLVTSSLQFILNTSLCYLFTLVVTNIVGISYSSNQFAITASLFIFILFIHFIRKFLTLEGELVLILVLAFLMTYLHMNNLSFYVWNLSYFSGILVFILSSVMIFMAVNVPALIYYSLSFIIGLADGFGR